MWWTILNSAKLPPPGNRSPPWIAQKKAPLAGGAKKKTLMGQLLLATLSPPLSMENALIAPISGKFRGSVVAGVFAP
jgi:hypothetical protein